MAFTFTFKFALNMNFIYTTLPERICQFSEKYRERAFFLVCVYECVQMIVGAV